MSTFNFTPVNAGQRSVDVRSELSATSTLGGFRLTGPACKALGIAPGDYAMFFHDDAADVWAIAKGILLKKASGEAQTCKPREAKDIVRNQFDEMYNAALQTADADFIAALTRDGITKEEQVDLLSDAITTEKYHGSKTANTSGVIGVGATVTFTDTNVWNQMKKDLADPTSIVRKYALSDELVEITVNNGYEEVVVKALVLGEYKDVAPVVRGKGEAESAE